MPAKPKSPRVLADAFIGKFGSVPGSREWEFMRHAFCKGYEAAQRRTLRHYHASRCSVCHVRPKRGGDRQGSELCRHCYHQG